MPRQGRRQIADRKKKYSQEQRDKQLRELQMQLHQEQLQRSRGEEDGDSTSLPAARESDAT